MDHETHVMIGGSLSCHCINCGALGGTAAAALTCPKEPFSITPTSEMGDAHELAI